MRRSAVFLVCALLATSLSGAQQADLSLSTQLGRLPHVKAIEPFRGGYHLTFDQPVDHANPGGPHFSQQVYVMFTGDNDPVVLNTEGYSTNGPQGSEVRRLLGKANTVTVEHRYFGKSIPEPCDWKQLTVKNAADDMHAIVTSLKQVFKGKWVSTGASKGGQTALYYKTFYPHDVDATVAYVAPINLGQEDPRINQFMATVGDEATRKKVKDFQIALLKREDEVLAYLKPDPAKYRLGVAKAYEYGVLEYPYAFWQYGSNVKADLIPAPDAPVADLVKAYNAVNSMFYYSDAGIKMFEAFMYQAYTEVGYYNYDITDFKPYLKSNPNPTNMDLCPVGTKDTIVYNPSTLAKVFHFLQYEAQNVIYIYGETDAWSSTQMTLLGRTNSVKVVVKGAWHNADVKLASPEQKAEIYGALEQWMGVKVVRE